MAARHPFRSIVVRLLQIMRDANAQQRDLTQIEMQAELSSYDGYDDYSLGDHILYDPAPNEALSAILDDMVELGLLRRAEPQGDTGFDRWGLAATWKPVNGRQDGGNDLPPIDPGDGSDGDDGAGGLREVLGHPLLFALPPDDFDELLESMFAEVAP